MTNSYKSIWRSGKEYIVHDAPKKKYKTSFLSIECLWRKHGWKPPTEYRSDYLFKLNREKK